MKNVAIVSLCVLLFCGKTLFGFDARLLHFGAAYPTDEFGFGISAVTDTLYMWKFSQMLANQNLFPTHTVLLDYVGRTSQSLEFHGTERFPDPGYTGFHGGPAVNRAVPTAVRNHTIKGRGRFSAP